MKMLEFTNSSTYNKVLRSKWSWPTILTISALACGVLYFGEIQTPLRPLLALWFLLVCPGMAVIHIFDVKNTLLEWVLALALSISLSGIISTLQIYTRAWSPNFTMWVLLGITLVSVVIQGLLNIGIIAWPTTELNIPKESRKMGDDQ